MIESIKFRMWFKYGHSFIVSTMPLSFTLIFVYFHERYDYMTFRKGKSKKRDAFFFDTSLIFPPFFSFNIIEKRKKELFLRFLKEKVYICKRIADIKKIYRYEERKEFFRN